MSEAEYTFLEVLCFLVMCGLAYVICICSYSDDISKKESTFFSIVLTLLIFLCCVGEHHLTYDEGYQQGAKDIVKGIAVADTIYDQQRQTSKIIIKQKE